MIQKEFSKLISAVNQILAFSSNVDDTLQAKFAEIHFQKILSELFDGNFGYIFLENNDRNKASMF